MIPIELWEYVLEFVEDWYTVLSACQTTSVLWKYLVESMNLQTRLKYETQRIAIQNSKSWACSRAIMEQRCQLCGRTNAWGSVHQKWGIYAHLACINKEVISLAKASDVYDIPHEVLIRLPRYNNAVWKYHGGRRGLGFTVASTIQGLSLAVYHENLHDRRERIKALKESLKAENEHDSKDMVSMKRKLEQVYEHDKKSILSAKKTRMDKVMKVRESHLMKLFEKYRIESQTLRDEYREKCLTSLVMPKTWKEIERMMGVQKKNA